MAGPTSREQLKEFCLRQLGHPVLEINVDDDQVEDCLDLAFEFFQDFHVDGVERVYMKHQMTADDKEQRFIEIPDNIIGVTRIFPISASNATVNMFDLRYQLRLHELYDFTSTSYVNYVLTQQHIRTLDLLFSGEQPIRFNRHSNKLYIDWNWEHASDIDDWIVIEGYVILDPDYYPRVYNDRLLKKLATAHIKRQWGTNMKKFQGMQLPGGIFMNGQQIHDEAVQEIKDIEFEIRSAHEAPPQFILG